MTAPSVSLVICTRNRAALLQPFFESLNRLQAKIPWELVFVDSASTDATPKMLQAFAEEAPFPVKVVRQDLPGLGRARNTGWSNASAPVIAFTDDDCYPAVDFIDQVHRQFIDASLGYLGGRVELFDPADLPITIKTDRNQADISAGAFIGPGILHGANLAFRKTALMQIGGFDNLMGSGTPFPAEDCDAVFRASIAGYGGRYAPEVLVHHHHRRRSPEDRQKIESSYEAGRGAFYMKALADSPKKVRTLIEWLKSANQFGWALLPNEISVGRAYLKYRKIAKQE